MADTKLTTSGHALADAAWLDHHFESARSEYEESVRHVGLKPGWSVLDAGCGGGNFLPLMCELVGPQGRVTAMDLASENVAHVGTLIGEDIYPATVQTKIGSVLDLPFSEAKFDCVWTANVAQYLSETEFERAISEFKRVLKPAGVLAIKEHDVSIAQLLPMDPYILSRFNAARFANPAKPGLLGACGNTMPSRLRKAGLVEISRKGWLVERWAPVGPHTRRFVEQLVSHYAGLAAKMELPEADLTTWREAAANPNHLLDDPDFCEREFFVLTTGKTPS